MNIERSTSESAFEKALEQEKLGNTAHAERWLKLACKKEAEERADPSLLVVKAA